MRCRSFLALPLFLILAGCGGIANPPGIYTGEWGGEWIDTTQGRAGVLHVVIDNDGNVSGTLSETGVAGAAVVTGSVRGAGGQRLDATARYPAGRVIELNGEVQINAGAPETTTDDEIVGYVDMTESGRADARPFFAIGRIGGGPVTP